MYLSKSNEFPKQLCLPDSQEKILFGQNQKNINKIQQVLSIGSYICVIDKFDAGCKELAQFSTVS